MVIFMKDKRVPFNTSLERVVADEVIGISQEIGTSNSKILADMVSCFMQFITLSELDDLLLERFSKNDLDKMRKVVKEQGNRL